MLAVAFQASLAISGAMKNLLVIACMMALVAAPAPLLASEECDFDQAYLASKLLDLAARHRGGTVDARERHVVWQLLDGGSVVVAHGGCVDLGTSIRLTFAPGRRPATREAIGRLLAVVSQYWAPRDAKHIAAVLAAGKFEARVGGDGTVEFEADRDPDSPFAFGFTVTLSATNVAVFWQEA